MSNRNSLSTRRSGKFAHCALVWNSRVKRIVGTRRHHWRGCSTVALTNTGVTNCADFLEDFPFDTFGQVTGSAVETNNSVGTVEDGVNTGTVTGGDETGTQRECADPNRLDAPYVLVTANTLTGHTKWTCDKIYILAQDAQVEVRDGVLDIEPGTTIKGKAGSALIIEKDAMINAVGTPDKPIVFTSDKTTNRSPGDWGGLALLGKAPTNQGPDLYAEGFAIPRSYGGDDPAHNCGTLQYLRVEWAGFALTTDNELNGITFYGCGSQTTMDHVQVHMGLDDGIEWFGGGFDAHHLIVTGAKDDALDIDLGFQGALQHIFVHQDPNRGDNAFEVSSNELDYAATPVTKPMIANATIIGSGGTGVKSRAFTFKQGARFGIYNTIAANSTNELFSFSSAETILPMIDGVSTVVGSILGTADSATALMKAEDIPMFTPDLFELWLVEPGRDNHLRKDPGFPSAAWGAHNIKPAKDGLASTGAASLPDGLEPTDYIGAVDPHAEGDWTKASWTNYSVQ